MLDKVVLAKESNANPFPTFTSCIHVSLLYPLHKHFSGGAFGIAKAKTSMKQTTRNPFHAGTEKLFPWKEGSSIKDFLFPVKMVRGRRTQWLWRLDEFVSSGTIGSAVTPQSARQTPGHRHKLRRGRKQCSYDHTRSSTYHLLLSLTHSCPRCSLK